MWTTVPFIILSPITFVAPTFTGEGPAPGNMLFSWIYGSLSVKDNSVVRIQVHRYSEHNHNGEFAWSSYCERINE